MCRQVSAGHSLGSNGDSFLRLNEVRVGKYHLSSQGMAWIFFCRAWENVLYKDEEALDGCLHE